MSDEVIDPHYWVCDGCSKYRTTGELTLPNGMVVDAEAWSEAARITASDDWIVILEHYIAEGFEVIADGTG
jgi:hypothetical protein